MTVPAFSPPIWGLIFAVCGSVILWLVSLRLRDVSIVDIFWGRHCRGGGYRRGLGHGSGPRTAAVILLVNLWGCGWRYIWTRHRGEDRRYTAMRTKFGPNWWWIS
jgi:steroid 5-alpha reductase family enzyme